MKYNFQDISSCSTQQTINRIRPPVKNHSWGWDITYTNTQDRKRSKGGFRNSLHSTQDVVLFLYIQVNSTAGTSLVFSNNEPKILYIFHFYSPSFTAICHKYSLTGIARCVSSAYLGKFGYNSAEWINLE